jgi:hypothetical protein
VSASVCWDEITPGQESIEHENGSVLYVLSGDEASGHGDTLHLAVLDEAWSLTLDAEQGVRPAMSTTGGQLWVVSTPGTRKSAYWREKVDAGRSPCRETRENAEN